ncbi:hypothetical protein C8R45DRAFT_1219493 [Mycena sanguinolenta]|nr:hypothetical protein C8R45DRAFT_1219493 [Mycena sanguinolenta]
MSNPIDTSVRGLAAQEDKKYHELLLQHKLLTLELEFEREKAERFQEEARFCFSIYFVWSQILPRLAAPAEDAGLLRLFRGYAQDGDGLTESSDSWETAFHQYRSRTTVDITNAIKEAQQSQASRKRNPGDAREYLISHHAKLRTHTKDTRTIDAINKGNELDDGEKDATAVTLFIHETEYSKSFQNVNFLDARNNTPSSCGRHVCTLNTPKATEILGVIRSLSQDGQDTLMKYLYKGMGMPGWGDISGSVLLGWHEKLGMY